MGKPDNLALGFVAYNNTLMDALRFMLDRKAAMPEGARALCGLMDQMAHRILSGLAPDAASDQIRGLRFEPWGRKKAAAHLLDLAQEVLEENQARARDKNDETLQLDRYSSAQFLRIYTEISARLERGEGVRGPGQSAASELQTINCIFNRVSALCDDPSSGRAGRNIVLLSNDGEPGSFQVNRQEVLSSTIEDVAEWSVGEMFRFAGSGRNTAGQLLSVFRIVPSPDVLLKYHHDVSPDPASRLCRELNLTVLLLAEDLAQGRLREQAQEDYRDRMRRLELDPGSIPEKAYARASGPAQRFMATVSQHLGKISCAEVAAHFPADGERKPGFLSLSPDRTLH